MKNSIALALIKRLVATGQLDADDIDEMCKELSEQDNYIIKAAWFEGAVGPEPGHGPVLRVVR